MSIGAVVSTFESITHMVDIYILNNVNLTKYNYATCNKGLTIAYICHSSNKWTTNLIMAMLDIFQIYILQYTVLLSPLESIW